jgi:CheY-like chemotaxis protein
MKRGSVVLIDDDEAELRLYEEAFKLTGFPRELITFSTGEAAYRFIADKNEEIFVIISDINMPAMSGPDLLRKINANPDLKMKCIPFLFFSNSENEKDIEEAYKLAVQGYFQKPFEIEELTALFKAIINYWSAARIPRHKHHRIHMEK